MDLKGMSQNLNVYIKPEDAYVCECGSDLFIQAANLMKVSTPLLDQKLKVMPFKPIFICIECQKKFDPNELKTKKEL